MSRDSASEQARALVHKGWNHLMSQRPLAAWGTWQQALRLDADSAAARQALETLEHAPDLPAAARRPYRFRKPADEARRRRWDRELRDRDAAEVADATRAFAAIADQAPDDAAAWYNRALCLAWGGDDRGAIACLEEAVRIEAATDPAAAVEAWTLAEVLRQGGGAENLADDLRFACNFAWHHDDTERLVSTFPEIRRIPAPADPTRPEVQARELEVLEWLDRPLPAAGDVASEADLPRVLATVYITPGTLRLSSPRVESLEQAEERLRRMLGPDVRPIERVAAPLPLPFLDADVWTARVPEGLPQDLVHELSREIVESYYENQWIHHPRQGLDGLSPLAASQAAGQGDAVARVKLEAVIRLREQLGARSSSLAMYQGYPFDRLRHRLGLAPANPGSVEEDDLSCAPLTALQAISPGELAEVRLADAFRSAAGFRDDSLTALFAAELARRGATEIERLDLPAVFAPLVRQAMQRSDPGEALSWLDQARPLANAAGRRDFDTWRAEILSRTGRGDEAARVYQDLVATGATPALVALDAAETFLDNGQHEQARDFLDRAIDLARAAGIRGVEDLANRHLSSLARNGR
ncbi:Tetratricopeptide repeat protein [Aquisphaera giovannonii]|uniref:Tetratricopeptide repeat protein n=1 Tax=Aquisphaera giovannonii TaxID=406548 RepID=A0A5B9W9C9_9BACT|nr:hypothetical protein [Aquisphaera giovannonii]QEH37238.1 Tetratricopeptide repeat protein [Aquisphaera giovannonii]